MYYAELTIKSGEIYWRSYIGRNGDEFVLVSIGHGLSNAHFFDNQNEAKATADDIATKLKKQGKNVVECMIVHGAPKAEEL